MEFQTKTCQNCKKDFVIEPDDFAFYEKMKVPPPTWCPECRMARRMIWRSGVLYKRKCDAPNHNESVISIFNESSPIKTYDSTYWWSDEWDAVSYGREYDFNRPFFEQMRDLIFSVPQNNLFSKNNVNCDYVNFFEGSKNCYLSQGGTGNENVLYSNHAIFSKNSVGLYASSNLESCYECVICEQSYKLFYGVNCGNCVDSWFLYDCRNCQNCFGCVGLRNKNFHIFNKPYTKEEYYKKMEEFSSGSFLIVEELKKKFSELKKLFPHKFAHITNASDSTGDYIFRGAKIRSSFNIIAGENENVAYSFWVGSGVRDAYDLAGGGVQGELLYEGASLAKSISRAAFSALVWTGSDVQYSFNCHNSSNLFGCVGLRNKQYCILNKQYSKEEYKLLVPKIIKHMDDLPYTDSAGRLYKYGEFFPPELSPFAYNETIAQEYFPLTKEEAEKQGYAWRDPDVKAYAITVKPADIPDNIKDVPDSIMNEIIGCAHAAPPADGCNHQCAAAFKVIPQELTFYRQMNLPLPRLCPNCRYYERLAQRNPLKLWKRRCQCAGPTSSSGVYKNTVSHNHGDKPCPNEFETSYAPDRPEIVYCESCYNAEVA